jgi:hypothetical protein
MQLSEPGKNAPGNSPGYLDSIERTPLGAHLTPHGMGSFDCVVVRKANDNFVQDDNFWKLSWLYSQTRRDMGHPAGVKRGKETTHQTRSVPTGRPTV